MIDFFTREFDAMCFIKDMSILTGICTIDVASKKFGESFIKKCIYEKKIIYIDKKTGD